jgi:tetratricopeptide (TPR) repeat protein
LVRGHQRKTREIAADLVARSERSDSPEHLAEAASLLGFADMVGGAFEEAREDLNRAGQVFESLPKAEAGAAQLFPQIEVANHQIWSAWNLWFLGYPGQSLARVNSILAYARKSGLKPVQEGTETFALMVYHLLRDVDAVKASGQATIAVATELGNPFRVAVGGIYLGWAEAMSDPEHGLASMKHRLADFRATGSETMTHYTLALIAEIIGRMRRFDEALSTIEQAFPIIEQTNERFYEAEINRLKGELLIARDSSDSASAEACFRTAIEIARRQKARSWELRATTSLARLLRMDRRDEARAMLSDIYNWFTEGFDTADLKDAKALLDELAGAAE